MSYTAMGGAAYRRDEVFTATPLRLVVLTMNGALNRLERARRAADRGDSPAYRSELNRGRALIAELLGALDHTAGGEIARELAAIYEFMLTKLLRPKPQLDKVGLEQAHALLKTIKDGFDVLLTNGAEKITVGA
jgi:flagellar secretion chaperone FliS